MVLEGIETLMIDMYGVVTGRARGKFVEYTLARRPREEHCRIRRLLRTQKLMEKAFAGEITCEELMTALGYDDPEYSMRDYAEHNIKVDKSFIWFAERNSRKYEFALTSNDIAQWSEYTLERSGMDEHFMYRVISSDIHVRKPDEEFFKKALEIVGKPPEKCLFIDNTPRNLEAAAGLGINTVWFDRGYGKVEYEGLTVKSFRGLERLLGEAPEEESKADGTSGNE